MDDRAPKRGDMDPEQFRKYGHKVVDQMADYLSNLERYDVLPDVKPGEVSAHIPSNPPKHSEAMPRILSDFQSFVQPNITHWQSPNFMAYFPSVANGAGILGEMLSAALNSNVMFWRNAPASTEVEQRVVEWLTQMLGLPDSFDGMLTDTASMSSLLSYVAARERHPKIKGRLTGIAGQKDLGPLVVYQSEEAHMSLDKSARVCGVGFDYIRKIPTDANLRLRVDLLQEAIETDLNQGLTPFLVAGVIGTTSSTAVDPVAEMGALCKRYDLWFHIDAAYAGAAAILPEMRHLFAGWETANSIVFNPHKWMFTPFDASLLLFKDPDAYRNAFSIVPEYIKTSEQAVKNYNEFGVQLGRRFRALKLWFQIRYFGVEGIQKRIRQSIEQAKQFRAWVEQADYWEIMAEGSFSTLCLRWNPGNLDASKLEQANQKILDTVNASGEIYLSHTKLREEYVIRVALGNPRTEMRHLDHCWKLLNQAAIEVKTDMGL